MQTGRDKQRETVLRAMITARDARIAALEKEVAALKARLASTRPADGGLMPRPPLAEPRGPRPRLRLHG